MTTNNKKNLFTVFFSIFITLFLIEIFFKFIVYKDLENLRNNPYERFMLFEEGEVFQNIGKIGKYYPNKRILSETYYKVDGEFLKEYSYEITTNNFGLVQNTKIDKNKESILFLGNSNAEGQGVSPWIYNFKGKYKDYQIINGGIFGMGPAQFELMEKHISKDFNVKKVIFYYIGDDMRRGTPIFPPQTLECLKSYLNCKGNENIYGFQLRDKKPNNFLKFLAKYRDEQGKLKSKNFKYYRRKIKSSLSSLYIISMPLGFIKQKFYDSDNERIMKNFRSIDNLHKKYKNNIYFIQLMTKAGVLANTKSYDTLYAEKYIKKLTDKHFYCDFENDINNFFVIDGHPNAKGYQSLYKCTKKILDEN